VEDRDVIGGPVQGDAMKLHDQADYTTQEV
jgi:hypothetical protein